MRLLPGSDVAGLHGIGESALVLTKALSAAAGPLGRISVAAGTDWAIGRWCRFLAPCLVESMVDPQVLAGRSQDVVIQRSHQLAMAHRTARRSLPRGLRAPLTSVTRALSTGSSRVLLAPCLVEPLFEAEIVAVRDDVCALKEMRTKGTARWSLLRGAVTPSACVAWGLGRVRMMGRLMVVVVGVVLNGSSHEERRCCGGDSATI